MESYKSSQPVTTTLEGSGVRMTPARGTVSSDVWVPLLQASAAALLIGACAVGVALGVKVSPWGFLLTVMAGAALGLYLWQIKALRLALWATEQWERQGAPVVQNIHVPSRPPITTNRPAYTDDELGWLDRVRFVDLCLKHGTTFRALDGKPLARMGSVLNQRTWSELREELIAKNVGWVDGRDTLRITMSRDEILDALGVPEKLRGV